MSRSRLSLLVLCGLALVLAACGPSRSLTVLTQPDATRASRALTQRALRQTLLVPEEGMSEIEVVMVLPRSAPALAQRPLEWHLRDSFQQSLGSGTIETASFPHNTPLRLHFNPLPAGERVELLLTAPPEAQLALWTSSADRYLQGSIADNGSESAVDLHFTLRTDETLSSLFASLQQVTNRWRRLAIWLPLLLVTPGWLLAWVLRPGGRLPVAPLVSGLSLALAPIVYLWASLIGLRLYEPLVQSLFQAAALLLLLLMLRDPARVRDAWQTSWRGALALLLVIIGLGIATWLLAARTLVTPPGESAPALVLLAEELVREGLLLQESPPRPPAALAATLTQLSRQPVSDMLLLSTLLLGVSLVPALFALAAEVGRKAWIALWVLPLAWLWPAPWQALARGDLLALYSIALLPVAMALGLRALRVTERGWQTVVLASVPLAALALAQGGRALVVWGLTLALSLLRAPDGAEGAFPLTWPQRVGRALGWLAGATVLWLPARAQWDAPLIPPLDSAWAGYLLAGMVLLLAGAAGWWGAYRHAPAGVLTLLLLLTLPMLGWWRSAPLEIVGIQMGESERQALEWIPTSVPDDALFLINLREEDGTLKPTDGGAWLPVYAERTTVLERPLPAALLRRAMQPAALADPALRLELQEAGVTHIFIGAVGGPLDPLLLLNQPWAQLLHQEGDSYIFQLSPAVSYHLPPR